MGASQPVNWLWSILRQPSVTELVDHFDLTETELGLLGSCLKSLERVFGNETGEMFSLESVRAVLRDVQAQGPDSFMRREWNDVLTANPRYQPFVVAFTTMGLQSDYQRLTPERRDNLWAAVFALFRLLRQKYPRPQLRLVALD